MIFSVHTTKTANKFHFISNLTRWHFSAREKDNKRWLKETGRLTQKEKNALRVFTKILKKYNFGKNFIGKPFTKGSEKEIWINVKKFVNKKEFEQIQEVFSVFDKRFEKIWKKDKKKLQDWQGRLEKSLNKNKKIKEIFKKSKIFFRVKNLPKNIEIYLLIGNGGGGANIGQNAITLDVANRPASFLKHILGIVLHEVLHLISNSSNYYSRLMEGTVKRLRVSKKHPFMTSKMGKRTIINEAIISVLCPEGYVFIKYFLNLSDKKANEYLETRIHDARNKFSKWRSFFAKEYYSMVKYYFENKKPIDKPFFKNSIQIFKKFNLY